MTRSLDEILKLLDELLKGAAFDRATHRVSMLPLRGDVVMARQSIDALRGVRSGQLVLVGTQLIEELIKHLEEMGVEQINVTLPDIRARIGA
jgi:hypothetical protein